MKYLKRFMEFWQGLELINRCPNCEGSFFKNGEGGLETVVYVENDRVTSSEEVTICVKCLSNSASLDRGKIRIGLQKRGNTEDDIKNAFDAVDRFLKGEIPYSIWKEAA